VFELLGPGVQAANKHNTATRIGNRFIEYIFRAPPTGAEQQAFQLQRGVLRGFLHYLRTMLVLSRSVL
jgi:hypothetical protein